MAANMEIPNPQRWGVLRKLPWIVAAVLLLLPAVAMRFDVEGVAWTASDFVTMGAVLCVACACFELATRFAPNFTYLVAAALGIGTGFLLAWANLAVGIIGDGFGAANLMFFGVVLVALVASALARFRAARMPHAMLATAGAQVLAIAAGLAFFGANALEAGLALVFVAGWLASAGVVYLSAR